MRADLDSLPSPGVPAPCVIPVSESNVQDEGSLDTTGAQCPGTVQSVAVTPGLNSAVVSWQAPTNAAAAVVTNYVIDVRSQSRVVTVGANETSATISGLANGLEVGFVVHAVSALGSGPASAVVTTTPTTGVEGEVAGLIVKFESDAVVGDVVQFDGPLDTAVELPVIDEVTTDAVLVELPESLSIDDAEAIAREIADEPGVEWAEPDRFLFVSDTGADRNGAPDDSQWSTAQWNLWDRFGIGVADGNTSSTVGWNIGTGEGAVVAVIDTGITAHPDLDDRLVPGFDFVSDPAELAAPRVDGGDEVAFDGDYVDPATFGGLGRDDNPADPGDWRGVTPTRDSSWHGTAMAGVIAASADDAVGVAGVAPDARVQPVRALSWRGGLLSDIAASIVWASGGVVDGVPANATPADVVNLSFAVESTCPAALQDAIDGALARGVVVVAAAGNASSDAATFAPGNCAGVITVGATGRDGLRAPYSNWGATVDVSAPGGSPIGGVTTTSNDGSTAPTSASWDSVEGTSVSAAHVAGVVALLRAHDPSSTVDEVFELVTGSSNVRAFGATTCDGDPRRSCGAGIVSLAQIAMVRQDSVDYALNLNGTNQRAEARIGPSLSGQLTIEAWVKPSGSCSTSQNVLIQEEGYSLYCNAGSWIFRFKSGPTNGWADIATGVKVLPSAWQHVAITRNSLGRFTFYLNGQSYDLNINDSPYASIQPLGIGGYVGGSELFSGQIDEIRLWTVARTSSQIVDDMRNYGPILTGGVATPGLVAYYDFNDGSGTTILNRASGAAATSHLTTTGGPVFADVKSTATSGSNTIVTFPRSYLTSAGGWTVPNGVTAAATLVVTCSTASAIGPSTDACGLRPVCSSVIVSTMLQPCAPPSRTSASDGAYQRCASMRPPRRAGASCRTPQRLRGAWHSAQWPRVRTR